MINLTNEQRNALTQHLDRLYALDDQLARVAKRAEATGDLTDDLENQASRLIFNIGRAGDAAQAALGVLDEEPRLKIFMTDPAEIIARCIKLIDVSEEFIIVVRQRMGHAP